MNCDCWATASYVCFAPKMDQMEGISGGRSCAKRESISLRILTPLAALRGIIL